MGYQSDYANAIARITEARGAAQADATRANANIWGRTVSNLGQMISQIPEQRAQLAIVKQRAEAAERQRKKDEEEGRKQEVMKTLLQKHGGFNDAFIDEYAATVDPIEGAKLKEGATKAKIAALEWQDKQLTHQTNELNHWASVFADVSDDDSYGQAKLTASMLGNDVSQWPPTYAEASSMITALKKGTEEGRKQAEAKRKQLEADRAALVATPSSTGTGAVWGQKVAGAPVYEKPGAAGIPNVGSFEDYVLRKYGPNPTPEQITAARKAYMQADDRPTGTANPQDREDAEAIADAIIAGEQPPELTGLYGKGAAVRAALARKGYNQAQALTDWRATQKHVATLNSAQQTRMGQAIDNAAHSLDVIEELANQWDGGKFPVLNKGRLIAATNGTLGPKAQQIATQLKAQIADVTSELANVYMGGNSPTDHALDLAAKNLSADWTRDQLKSAIELSRRNLKIRANSMRNVGVAGASVGNPYAAPPAVEQWERGPDGKLRKVTK